MTFTVASSRSPDLERAAEKLLDQRTVVVREHDRPLGALEELPLMSLKMNETLSLRAFTRRNAISPAATSAPMQSVPRYMAWMSRRRVRQLSGMTDDAAVVAQLQDLRPREPEEEDVEQRPCAHLERLAPQLLHRRTFDGSIFRFAYGRSDAVVDRGRHDANETHHERHRQRELDRPASRARFRWR